MRACAQRGFSGSAMYWPHEGCSELYGDVRVRCVGEAVGPPGTVLRQLNVSANAEPDPSTSTPTGCRRVIHVHFTAWPNYGVPEDVEAFCAMLRTVCTLQDGCVLGASEHDALGASDGDQLVSSGEHAEVQLDAADRSFRAVAGVGAASPSAAAAAAAGEPTASTQLRDAQAAPLLVHCSGGVGRSGAFVAVHSAWRAATSVEKENASPPSWWSSAGIQLGPIVTSMRQQRHPWMVETFEQYAFCYEALLHLLDQRQQG
jgi:protein tyrosine phosphatase